MASDVKLRMCALGEKYSQYRQLIMSQFNLGLTALYNRLHDALDTDPRIMEMRNLQVEVDQAVVIIYGWQGLDLDHGFHETKQGIRFTISEAARREVLDRLLALNHQRHAEEVAAGLHDKKTNKAVGAKRGRKNKDNSSQTAMDL
jgi:hypothetical protein